MCGLLRRHFSAARNTQDASKSDGIMVPTRHLKLKNRFKRQFVAHLWHTENKNIPCCQLVNTLLDYYCAEILGPQIFLQEMPRTRSVSLIQQAYVRCHSSAQETIVVRPCPHGNQKKLLQWKCMTSVCQVRSSLTLNVCVGSSSSGSLLFFREVRVQENSFTFRQLLNCARTRVWRIMCSIVP